MPGIQQKTFTFIGNQQEEIKITIDQFACLEVQRLRDRLISHVKNQMPRGVGLGGGVELAVEGLKSLGALLYQFDEKLLLDLLKKCVVENAVDQITGETIRVPLNSAANIDKALGNNADVLNMLLIEVVDFSNFFTKAFFTFAMAKFPQFNEYAEAIKKEFAAMKAKMLKSPNPNSTPTNNSPSNEQTN